MTAEPSDLAKLLHLLDMTAAEEIDCDEFLHRAAGFVERISASAEPPVGWEDVVQHLSVCPECLEELEVVKNILRPQCPPGDASP